MQQFPRQRTKNKISTRGGKKAVYPAEHTGNMTGKTENKINRHQGAGHEGRVSEEHKNVTYK